MSEIRVFAHDNGVIDDNAKRDDQREKRYHVDGQPRDIHQSNRAEHGHRNTRRHPERSARVEEQEQQQHHQAEPHSPVIDQNIQPPGDGLRAGADQVDAGARWQRQREVFRDLRHLRLNANCVASVGAIHPHGDRRVIAPEIGALPVSAFNQNGRHIADGQLGAVRVGSQDNRRNLRGVSFGNPGAHPRIAPRHVARRIR